MNIKDSTNFIAANRIEWKRSLVEHFCSVGYTHALTLSWNRDTPLPVAKGHIKTLHGIVERKLLGCRYHLKPLDQRTKAVFTFEGLGQGGHLHVHSLWRIRRNHLLRFARILNGGAWSRIVASGSYDLDLADDPTVFAAYALKGQHMVAEADEIIWSDEFVRP